MKTLFTICGRAGSKGFKNKNLKKMNGIPLVYYTLAAIKGFWEKYEENDVLIAVNTDSTELADMISDQTVLNNIKFFKRKPELAGDVVAKVEVIKDTYLQVRNEFRPDVVIDLDITSPMRAVDDLSAIIKVYQSNAQYDLVFSVVESRRSPYFNMVEKKEDSFYRKVCSSKVTARQQASACYELNASIYAYRPSFLEKEISGTILDHNCGIAMMKDYLVLDIDSEDDFQMMSMLHQYYCEMDEGIREVNELAKEFV